MLNLRVCRFAEWRKVSHGITRRTTRPGADPKGPAWGWPGLSLSPGYMPPRYPDDMSCTWPVDRSCLPIADTEVDRAQQKAAEDLAVQVLWALSGRQFGVCPVIVRPCPQPCSGFDGLSWGGGWFFPVWDGSNWRNVACGCGPKCSWQSPSVIHLASRVALPVQAVIEIVIEGEILDPSEYRLEGDLLYRVNGQWPAQDLTRPLDEPGTWSVTYTRGNPPPPGSAKLVGLLANEFLAACNGGKCRLPRRVQNVTRQGVTYQMVNPVDIYKEGRTGLDEVDLWLSAVNPHRLQEAPSVR